MAGGSKPCNPDCKCGKHRHPDWTPSKRRMHYRLAEKLGKAKEHKCVDCGGDAVEWSQTHGTDGMSFDHYKARCVACHRKYDYPVVFDEKRREAFSERMRGNQHTKGMKGVWKCEPGCGCKKHTNSGRYDHALAQKRR